MSVPQPPPPSKVINGIRFVDLYGGAFTMEVPERFVDISYYRHLPNHQEVYIDPDGDQSIITELNSYQDVPNDKALSYVSLQSTNTLTHNGYCFVIVYPSMTRQSFSPHITQSTHPWL